MCGPTPTATTTTKEEEVEDPRPLVSDLLEKHKDGIAVVRKAVQAHALYKGNEERYDDIWILRFVMSHKGKSKAAIAAAVKTMQYRHEEKLNQLGDVRHKIYNHNLSIDENADAYDVYKIYNRYVDHDKQEEFGIAHTHPDPDGGIVSFIMVHQIHLTEMAQNMTQEQLAKVYMLADESFFQIMDDVTRRTGRWTKLLRVMDFKDMSLMKLDHKYAKMDAAAAKANEDYYPQLLGTVLVVNAPSWVYKVWSTLRVLFPKRMVEKLDFCNPTKSKKDLDRFLQYMSIQDLPERYGGQSKVWPPVYGGDRFQKVIDQQKKQHDTTNVEC